MTGMRKHMGSFSKAYGRCMGRFPDMTPRIVRTAVAMTLLIAAPSAIAQFPQIPGLGKAGATDGLGAGLSDSQIGSGLKEALAVGTQKAVTQVAQPGGYLENAEIKILLPKNLQSLERVMRGAGEGPKIDDFVANMNHAAESAAPEAASIFADAVRAMTIDDARKLLNGGNTSITEYFKSKTSDKLTAAFRPPVEAAMQKNGVTQQYQALMGSAPKLPFSSGGGSFDIDAYVVGKSLDGLFYTLGEQEKEIRSNPAARTTGLLKQVFGR
jgi:hypothetical protein